ncbi:efflux RND transporter periplasmic adaptor subunit [Pedobacter suwonensis]|uniref:efflux RND transporter periplasmic adaptor subunit n=1 Tax=Pedobacter suwonensis TaxID=332999 RepID=UPI0011A164FD|nr:efflux RND transporter periplasmic adaptor subunit [Pedobacter suwonensis]
MNNIKRNSLKRIFTLLFIVLSISVFNSCKQKAQPVAQAKSKFYYTCSMHPQIHEDHPGNCPICGMKLIKVELTGSGNSATEKITLTASQIQLAGITVDTVREENTGNEKLLTGTVATDESKAEEISARAAGRIQRLFVRSVGQKITMGQAVYSIYSEDLLSAEKEYLLARQQQKVLNNPDVDYDALISTAEHKLLLWGLNAAQIKNLSSLSKTSATVTIYSKVNGTVSDIAIHEGDYVTEGMAILKTQGLNSLWVEAQLYASESGNYKENDIVNVSFPDLNWQVIKGKVGFINPELSDDSKVVLIRVAVPNTLGLIRPGMLAYIAIGNGKQNNVAIPASSILATGKGNKVWIKNRDGSFSERKINTGAGNPGYVQVVSGISQGEVVVTGGAYLLESELVFKNGG